MKNIETIKSKRDYDDDEFVQTNKVLLGDFAKSYCLYLTNEIGSVNEYVEWLHLLKYASPHDNFVVVVNSGGGHAYTALQIAHAMRTTKASVHARIEGLCCSAATLIMLAADTVEIMPHSSFMFHTYSSGTFGKGHEMESQILYDKEWWNDIVNDFYKNFLSDEEIKMILGGKDLWLKPKEIIDRMKTRIEFMQKQQPEISEEDIFDDLEEDTIDTLKLKISSIDKLKKTMQKKLKEMEVVDTGTKSTKSTKAKK